VRFVSGSRIATLPAADGYGKMGAVVWRMRAR
jgi:hypothetical protein